MKVRSVTNWTTRTGKIRRIRLYSSWKNMRGRVSGRLRAGSGARPWMGKTIGWANFQEFRRWALANGYSKQRCSLDREKSSGHYEPGNCRWLTVAQNTKHQNYCVGAVDPDYLDVPF